MKTTVTTLKALVKRKTVNTGYVLSKRNPYYANDEQIKYMEQAIQEIKEAGEAEPNKRYEITPAQEKSLKNWIDGLKQIYLLDL